MVRDLIHNVFHDQVLRGLISLYLTFGLSELYVTLTYLFFLNLFSGGGENLSIYKKVYQESWKEWAGYGGQEDEAKIPFLPPNKLNFGLII